jgi:hypothetical protein
MRPPFPLTWLERRALRRIEQRLAGVAEHDRTADNLLRCVISLIFADRDARRRER